MAIIVQDNFNRADNPTSLGTATTGQAWNQTSGVSGSFGINSNEALWTWNSGDPSGLVILDTGFTDAITQVDLLNPNDTAVNFAIGAGILFRYVDTNYYWSLIYRIFGVSTGRLRLHRTYAGLTTTAIDIPVVLNNGDTISAAYCGSNFEVFINSVSQGTYDDSHSPQNYGSSSGLIGVHGSYFANILRRFDNFLVTTNGTCTPTYNCTGAGCVDPGDGSGTYPTLEACLAACVIAESYNCIDGTCIDPGDGTGEFSTLLECQQSGCANLQVETLQFDAGEGSSYYVAAQVTDSGDELRSKTYKSVRVTSRRTNQSAMVYGYDAEQEISTDDLETGTRSDARMTTAPQSFADSAGVSQSVRKQVNIKNAVLSSVRVEGNDTGNEQRDQIHEIVVEAAREGVRR